MKASILKSFDSEGTGLKLKTLRTTALAPLLEEGESDKKQLKEQFESCLATLVEKGKVVEVNGVYNKALKDKKKRKLDADADDVTEKIKKKEKTTSDMNVKKEKTTAVIINDADDELKIKAVKDAATAAAYNSYSAASANSKMDLSKFGEQAWKDGTFFPRNL
jgi:hypothetical protein